jgi:predicted alpha/beta-fold hydrolase
MASVPPYTPPGILFNRHLETIYPSVLRSIRLNAPDVERLETPDDDFLILDWYTQGSPHCVIISHGLEGNSRRSYVRGMAKALFDEGYDVLAWNYRGCSGEINRQLRFYHSGATDDLHTVVTRAAHEYNSLYLVGFSLGGNVTLKYLGEGSTPAPVRKAVAFSVPLNLHTSCIAISQPANWVYTQRFLRSLKNKVRSKQALRTVLDVEKVDKINSLLEFDNLITGPLHGFTDALDYYTRCSSLQALPAIQVPTLVVNARNDPFLSPECFPDPSSNPHIQFEYPLRGGHVGFALFNENGVYWSEQRAVAFLNDRT